MPSSATRHSFPTVRRPFPLLFPTVRAKGAAFVLDIIGELRTRGFLARWETPEAQLMSARVSALFWRRACGLHH